MPSTLCQIHHPVLHLDSMIATENDFLYLLGPAKSSAN